MTKEIIVLYCNSFIDQARHSLIKFEQNTYSHYTFLQVRKLTIIFFKRFCLRLRKKTYNFLMEMGRSDCQSRLNCQSSFFIFLLNSFLSIK
jgi:hypothetical protein